MSGTFVKVFRATSGSGLVYFDETEAEPPGVTNKVVIAQKLTENPVTVGSGSLVLWKWNGTDLSQFDLNPVQEQGISASLEIITSSYSPTSKSLLVSGTVGSATAGDHIVFLATSSLPTTRYIMEMTIRTVDDAGGLSYAGPVVLAFSSGSNFHGVGTFQVNDGSNTLALPLWQTGALNDSLSNVTNTTGINPMNMFVSVRGGVNTSSSYSFVIQPRPYPEFGSKYSGIFPDQSWEPLGLISTWTTSSIGRFGFGIRCSAGASDPKIIIDNILIRTDPYVI